MNIAEMRFGWQPQSPLLSGYDYKFSREAELIQAGEKKVLHYQSRNQQQQMTPSLLATSVKGVLRSAAAWWVERSGQVVQGEAGPRRYITFDYASARPEEGGWRKTVGVVERSDQLDPVSRVFGGSGNLGDASSNVLRRQSLIQVRFVQNDLPSDALFGKTVWAGQQFFAWEEASGKGNPKPLETQQLRLQPGAQLALRVQPSAQPGADEEFRLAIALLGLSADLISSGFFRFGRFTSRGYGWVRLAEPQGRVFALGDLLTTAAPAWPAPAANGTALARQLLQANPAQVVRGAVEEWLRRE